MKPTLYRTNEQTHVGGFKSYEVEVDGIEGQVKSQHPGLEIIYGTGFKMQLRGRVWEGQAKTNQGAMMIYNGLEEHVEHYDKRDALRLTAVVVDANMIDQLGKDLGFQAANLEIHQPFLQNPDQNLLNVFHAMIQMRDLPGLSPYFHDCLATDLAVRVLTNLDSNFSAKIKLQSEKKCFPKHFLKAKQIMRETMANPDFSLEHLSTACGLSKFHFIRMFKQNVGMSPHQYLNQLKVDQAKQLLMKTNYSINIIAQMLGFTEQSTFTKLFKRLTGLPATAYRQRLQSVPTY
jgi:AraC-like DNA-binding protein